MIAFVVGGMIIQDLARQFNSILISSVVYTLGAFFLCVHLLLSSTVDLAPKRCWRRVCGPGCLWCLPELWRPPSVIRSEEHTSELQSLIRNSYAVFVLKKK